MLMLSSDYQVRAHWYLRPQLSRSYDFLLHLPILSSGSTDGDPEAVRSNHRCLIDPRVFLHRFN